MIHIVSEIIALVGITFYFNQKNKKMLEHINDLSKKVEEQHNLLQKHEQVIKEMLEFISQQNHPIIEQPVSTKQLDTSKIRKKLPIKEIHTKPPLKVPKFVKPEPTKVSFNDEILKSSRRVIESEESEEEESDLDAELAEELEELEIDEEIDLAHLKKRA